MIPVSGVQCAISETMICPAKCDDAFSACGQDRGLERGLDRFEPGVAEDRFPVRHERPTLVRPGGLAIPPAERELTKLLGQARLKRMRVDVAHRVQELGHLLLTGLDNS